MASLATELPLELSNFIVDSLAATKLLGISLVSSRMEAAGTLATIQIWNKNENKIQNGIE